MEGNILIAVPAFGGMIHFKTSEALRLLDHELTRIGVAHTIRYLGNESLVTRARNWFANLALFGKDENGAQFTHLLFVDADIIFSPANVIEMLQANRPIVSLPYSKKGIDWANVATAARAGIPADQLPHYAGFPVFGIPDGEIDLQQPTPAYAVGSGAMLIKISALRALADANPDWKYKIGISEVQFRGSEGDAYDFFQVGHDPATGYYLSEDYWFAAEAKKLGFETYLLPWAQTMHCGSFQYLMNFPADLGGFRFVHFATHGFFPVEPGIREPALVLSYDGEDEGRMMLTLSEVLQLKIHAEMVVLSACNTGSGRVTGAEGVTSLGTAFLAAGASSVTVSLWKVEDKSTSILMQQFYRNLLSGMSKKAALAAAKSTLASKGYTNPFFWPPFVLTGD
jgi:hypothetical protein